MTRRRAGDVPPRVVLVLGTFPKLSEVFIVNMFLGLLDRGLDVHVVCYESPEREWAWFEDFCDRRDVRARVHVSPYRSMRHDLSAAPWELLACLSTNPRGTFRYLRLAWGRFGPRVAPRLAMDNAFIRLRPDIVHFEFGALAARRMYLGELLDCRIAVSFRGSDINFAGLDKPGYYDDVWRRADGIHCLGADIWRRCLLRGCPRDKWHVEISPALGLAHSSLDEQPERPPSQMPSTERPLRILSVGRLEWKKGYEFALQAIKLVRDRGLPLSYEIVGDGTYREAVEWCRGQLGLEDCVQLVGAVRPQEVKRRLAEADLFLHAATSEGFANAVIEAQAAGVPVVCTDADGLPENVDPGTTGLVVPRRDPVSMADAILELAADPARRATMGRAGRERVHEHFQLKDQVSAFMAFYHDVYRGSAGGRVD